MINITGLSKTDNGMNENISLSRTGGSDGQFTVGSVHGVSGLESNNSLPAKLGELGSELSRGISETDIIVVVESVDGLELTTDVELLDSIVKVLDSRVLGVTSEDQLGLLLLVRSVDIFDSDNGKRSVVSKVTESNSGTGLDLGSLNFLLGNIKVDGNREEGAISKTQVLNNTIVVLLIQKALEGRKATREDKLQIAELAFSKNEILESLGLGKKFISNRGITSQKVLQDSSMGWVRHVV
jgi:hypothetical protein